ncbi:hypothetical protein BASA83_012575 [Batrachochytrium salamandrivorans]|nr:hypothetical protein BASA83_012575 [Batrachochytrium salamandrivorans]
MLVSSVITLLAISFASVSADNYAKFNLLKDDRASGRLVFPLTTLAQKKIILSNVENALAVSIVLVGEEERYGPAIIQDRPLWPGCRPIPYHQETARDINTVSDEQLQLGITDAFIMARDRHTRWTNMAPYGCFYATTGVRFTFIEGMLILLKTHCSCDVYCRFFQIPSPPWEGLLQHPS